MSQLETSPEIIEQEEALAWKPPMPPQDLIFDDGEPLESNRHRIGMNVLIDSVYEYWDAATENFFAGGNMFIYYSSEQVRNQDFKGPDFFVVKNVEPKETRQGWVVWEENGKYPDVIVELTSPSTRKIDLTTKKLIYEQTFKTSEYYIFDPFNPKSLQGWELNKFRYQEKKPNEQGWLWCESLGLWLGTWSGIILQETATWLRFYQPDGNLVLLPREKAEVERQKAEVERQKAEAERQKAEAERQKAEAERQRADRLAARLRELGVFEE